MFVHKHQHFSEAAVKCDIGAALRHGIRNPETETESRKRKRNTESVKEGSKRSIWKKMLAMTIK